MAAVTASSVTASGAQPGRARSNTTVCPADVWEATAADERAAGPDAERAADPGALGWLSSVGTVLALADLEAVVNMVAEMLGNAASVAHRRWCRAAPPRPTPLRPLVDAWQRLAPVWVPVETRADRRIMPALRVVGPTTERERGKLFGGLVDDRPREVTLTLFPHLEPERGAVDPRSSGWLPPPLDLQPQRLTAGRATVPRRAISGRRLLSRGRLVARRSNRGGAAQGRCLPGRHRTGSPGAARRRAGKHRSRLPPGTARPLLFIVEAQRSAP